MNRTGPTVAFLPARAKLCIGSLDRPELEVRAQYNPRELQIDKQVPWGDHGARDNRSGARRTGANPSEQSDLEFNGAPARSMTIELLFDSYESSVGSVDADIRALEEMSSVQDPESAEHERRRPHHCVVTWGSSKDGMRPFRCVIESLAVKYTMWNHDGTPLRATCTVKLKEAHRMAGARDVPADYGEKRRPPGWDRKRPAERDGMAAQAYMEWVAEALQPRRR